MSLMNEALVEEYEPIASGYYLANVARELLGLNVKAPVVEMLDQAAVILESALAWVHREASYERDG